MPPTPPIPHGAASDAARAALAAPIGPEEERLLAAIRDAPADDDQPRLVYADWLLERGDPRGELISTQCALTRTADDAPGREALERRVEDLLAQHRERWCGGLEELERGWFERGFLLGVQASARTLVRHADRLWRLSPFRLLQLGDPGGPLAACPALARYRALVFSRGDLRDALVQVARCPYLGELESLDLDGCSFDDAELIALARSPHLARLRALDLGGRAPGIRDGAGFGVAGLGALAGAPFAPHLAELRLRGRGLYGDLVDALAAFPALAVLDLGGNHLGRDAVTRLAELPLRLRTLGLSGTGLTDAGADALASAPLLDAVETLNVSSNPMGEAGGLALATSPRLRALRSLVYEGRYGFPNAAVAAAIARSLPRLGTLVLSFAQIGPAGAAAIAAGDLPQLGRLELVGNDVGDAGARALARSTTLPSLRSLDLSDNGITDAGALALAESPHLASLRSLQLRSTPLGKRAVDALRARFGDRVDVQDPA